MKARIKKIIPPKLWSGIKLSKELYILFLCFSYDFLRYYRHFGGGNRKNKTAIVSWLLQDIHRIEKGLTNQNFRFGFGVNVIKRMILNYKILDKLNGQDNGIYSDTLRMTENSLLSYQKYHLNHNVPHYFSKDEEFISIANKGLNPIAIRELIVENNHSKNFSELMRDRVSVRCFSDKPVSNTLLKEAIELAIKSPSVCNRQHWKVHSFKGDKMVELLKLQNGNESFRNDIHKILLVTSNLSYFVTPMERYQQYIDGGIFSANLINSLFFNGVYSCALNWSAHPSKDKRLHGMNYIGKDESIIMMLAIGFPKKDKILTCLSKKHACDFFLKIHE
ncbi:nitroreductase family protein [Pseudoalteromonas lipolytica]|uniref:nitroreductase family protein n=1 Tax=Pseudoalteromonas lipolytica TaxID=570156 RepID=UPI001427BE5A|nr:nitroreductase family protein [Pseudoalteromonas lipolytica]